jgi:hypothetical protein
LSVAYVYTCIYACTHAHMNAFTCICANVCTWVHIYISSFNSDSNPSGCEGWRIEPWTAKQKAVLAERDCGHLRLNSSNSFAQVCLERRQGKHSNPAPVHGRSVLTSWSPLPQGPPSPLGMHCVLKIPACIME